MGLRMGGGIGEALGNAPKSYEKYATRVIFDLVFFVMVSIVLLNVVFGIIIDTFAQLRDNRRERTRLLDNVCFICGLERSLIELHGKGWSYHFMVEHSPFAYLAFIIYCKYEKDITVWEIQSII